MMALAHVAERVTDDVESHIRRDPDAVTRAVGELADEEGMSRHWMNDAVTMRTCPKMPTRASGGPGQLVPDNRGGLDQPDDRDEAARGSSAGLG